MKTYYCRICGKLSHLGYIDHYGLIFGLECDCYINWLIEHGLEVPNE